MSAKDLISPYLNRFVAINTQKATAKLELCCKDGKVTVNFHHDLGAVEEVVPRLQSEIPAYSDILKKNVSTSQIKRLQRRAEVRAAEARDSTKKQQNIAENAKTEAEKATTVAEKAIEEAEEAKATAEEAKENLLKIERDSEKMLAKLKYQAEQAKVTLEKQKEIAQSYMKCKYCPEEFSSKN